MQRVNNIPNVPRNVAWNPRKQLHMLRHADNSGVPGAIVPTSVENAQPLAKLVFCAGALTTLLPAARKGLKSVKYATSKMTLTSSMSTLAAKLIG